MTTILQGGPHHGKILNDMPCNKILPAPGLTGFYKLTYPAWEDTNVYTWTPK